MIKDKSEELKKMVTKQGWYVEDLLRITAESFKERNSDLAKQIKHDYWDIYDSYLEILNFSQVLLGTFAPNSYYLRFTSGSVIVSKILLDITDRLKDIAENIICLVKEPEINQSIMLPEMFAFSQKMLRKSLRIYVDQNIEGAVGVCMQDAKIDEAYGGFKGEIIRIVQDNPRLINRGSMLLDISRAIEEISDFAVQIIETTYYILTARHYKCYEDELHEFSLELFKSQQ
ncbi:MAG TPA: phosphate uptake regulator PhoU [Fervidobacterium sp.]|nr:phosphate uptake regulator PhoU [Fervidobacterium sp.]HOQ38832.1 phosphate uptake regulator PhoU [Fervidobacterium sp.]HPP17398.1 phosphate uptake regulator PhoU [Fervidobacterium sp.]HPZ17717.1 phosphate uptake regulator PhoU [Fervidobacterium sp.]HQE48773.1 phosphate uptake regulator PhoU [Fervidobacterium sp.]